MAAQKESDEIQASITRHNELDKEQREAVKKANHLLQQHQLQQIQFKNQLREADKKQQRREQEMFEVRSPTDHNNTVNSQCRPL